MTWQCFMAEPTERARESLRRYAHGTDCPITGYHNASVDLGDVDYPFTADGRAGQGYDDFPHDDPRWPTRCACGYEFRPLDPWQHNLRRLYAGNGGAWPLADLPPGAMYDAPWLPGPWRGPDGRCLIVVLPTRAFWTIDGPASNAPGKLPGWDRTGTPPVITARPSIGSDGYHGWLTDGVLSDDLEGRTYG